MEKQTQNGFMYIGLMGLLLSVLILVIMYVRWMSMPTQTSRIDESLQPLTASGTVPTTRVQEYQADLDAAKKLEKSFETEKSKLENALIQ